MKLSPVPPNRSIAHGQSPTRLLLVEDYALLAEAMAELLRRAGLEVRIAESGQEAMEVAAVFLPDIVLCDMRLPDTSGLDLAKAYRAKPCTKRMLFVLHTAMDDAEMRTLEREISPDLVDLFVSKPLTQEKLDRLLTEFGSLQRSGMPAVRIAG